MLESIDKEARVIVSDARSALISDQPFWGVLALSLDLIESRGVETMATNGVMMAYNPDFVKSIPFDQVKAEVAHEVTHCAALHHTRRDDRDPKLWNIACDHAINPMLKAAGFQLGADWLLDNRFNGMAAEDIYRILEQEGSGGGGNRGAPGAPGTAPSMDKLDASNPVQDPGRAGAVMDAPGIAEGHDPRSAAATEQEQKWEVLVIQATNVAQAHGSLAGGVDRFAEAIRNPDVDWRSLTRAFVQRAAPQDYSWRRPNRRYLSQGLYLPGLHGEELGKIVMVNDDSGSIGQHVQEAFAGHVSSMMADAKPEEIILMHCDTRVHGVQHLKPSDMPIVFRNGKGGGGTDFRPPFEWLRERKIRPAALIYLTDMMGPFPERDPGFPVLWASTTSIRGPFGQTVPIRVR